jgi:signal transduction histidine kinase/CheY-like chemotaxis protein
MKRVLSFFLLVVLANSTTAFDTILVNQSYLDASITEYSDYLGTNDESLSILQVTKQTIDRQFSPVHGETLKYNQVSDTTWLKFATNNPTGKSVRMFLVIETPYVKSAELFFNLNEENGYSRVATGLDQAYDERPYQMGNFVLPVEISKGYQILYLKMSAIEATNMRIRLVDENTFLQQARTQLQLNTLVFTALLSIMAVSAIAYFRYRIKLSIWTAVFTLGLAINLSAWTGGIVSWFTWIPYLEVGANNFGAFLVLMSISRVLSGIRVENYTSWLNDAMVWISRFFALLALLSLSPLTVTLLPVQIIMIPVALTIISIYWFEHRPGTISERLAMIGFFSLLLYFISTTLVLVGLLSAFGMMKTQLSLLAIFSATFLSWSAWMSAKAKGSRVAVEGLHIPDVHWPLLRKINHELRGPINGVLGMTELLQDTTLSAHQQEYVNTVQTAGFSLLREADQLQNLIRIGLNRLPESEDEFDLYDLIEDTVQPFSRIAHGKQLELVLDIAPELPSRYRGNAHIISQVLSNLLDNALKFTEHGEVLLQVKPWQNQRIRFSITDTGPGIAKDSKSQLFNFPDPKSDHQQLPKDVNLGLPISKYLVGLLGGQLSLSSELRMGTTFWIDLPLTAVHQSESAQPRFKNLPVEELRFMVVDDNLTCRKVIEHLAMSWGADVLSMSNGQSALANLHNQFHKGEPIDVLILDQNMPTMSGFELAQRIRQDKGLNQDIVILIMTGADDVVTDFQEGDADIEYVMSKPVSARALRETIELAMPRIIKNREKHHAKKSLFF